jgi:hypothetical protein
VSNPFVTIHSTAWQRARDGLDLGRSRVWKVFALLAAGAGAAAAAAIGGASSWAGLGGGACALASLTLLPALLRRDAAATAVLTALAFGIGGGGAALSNSVTLPQPPPRWTVEEHPLLETQAAPREAAPASRRHERVCAPGPADDAGTEPTGGARTELAYVKKAIYDYDELIVEPLPFGPLIKDDLRSGVPRSLYDVQQALERHRPLLKACYRWARFRRPGLQGLVAIRLELGYLGVAATAQARAETRGGAELAGCVRDVLLGLQVPPYPFRRADVQVRIGFRPSGQIHPPRPPARPRATRAAPVLPGGCVQVPDLPPDRLKATRPLLVVDDFDQAQQRVMDHRVFLERLERWRRGERPRPVRQPRILMWHTSCGYVHPGKDTLIAVVRRNMGRYRQCYRAALKRRPGLRGRVTVQAVVQRLGSVTAAIQSSTVGDPTLERCLQRAVEELWFVPPGQLLILGVPLTLRPADASGGQVAALARRATVARIERGATARRRAGDSLGALRLYRALLHQRAHHLRACSWHVGALEAAQEAEGWQGARVTREAGELAEHLRRRRRGPGDAACRRRAAAALAGLATRPHLLARRARTTAFKEAAVRRYRWLVSLRPALTNVVKLRFYLAEALYGLGHHDEAAVHYAAVARTPGEHMQEAALGLAHCRRLSWHRAQSLAPSSSITTAVP